MMLLRATLALALSLPAVPAFAAGPGGTYRGTYTCLPGQGVTGDTSTLFVDRRNRAKLFQVVYPVPGGQVFPNGVFEYAGTYDPASRISQLHLRDDRGREPLLGAAPVPAAVRGERGRGDRAAVHADPGLHRQG